jgi:hypothetical protein
MVKTERTIGTGANLSAVKRVEHGRRRIFELLDGPGELCVAAGAGLHQRLTHPPESQP